MTDLNVNRIYSSFSAHSRWSTNYFCIQSIILQHNRPVLKFKWASTSMSLGSQPSSYRRGWMQSLVCYLICILSCISPSGKTRWGIWYFMQFVLSPTFDISASNEPYDKVYFSRESLDTLPKFESLNMGMILGYRWSILRGERWESGKVPIAKADDVPTWESLIRSAILSLILTRKKEIMEDKSLS